MQFFIKSSQELLDKAFRRAKNVKESLSRKTIKERLQEKALNKISTIDNVLYDDINKIIKSYPIFEELSPFYQQLFREYVFVKAYKRSLRNLSWTRKKIRELSTYYKKKIKNASTTSQISNWLKSYYGRISSLIYDLEKDLNLLFEVKRIWQKFPVIDTSKPIFVFAGYPNVGKSSLINALTSANIEIAPYPFTTKHLNIGKIDDIILVDTPGILEKRINKMNDVEKRAAIALTYLTKNIIFVFDPSLSSGYDLFQQMDLLKDLTQQISFKPLLLVVNKEDLLCDDEKKKVKEILEKEFPSSEVVFVSALKGKGIKDLKDKIINLSYKTYGLPSMRIRRELNE